MGLYRQGEKDQGARIGRLEDYVYQYHGAPAPSQPPVAGQPPVQPPVIQPPVYPNVPGSVPANTPVVSGGQIPFSGDVQLLKNLNMFGANSALQFLAPGGVQEIKGVGTNGVGTWSIGVPLQGLDSLYIMNSMNGDHGGRMQLDDLGMIRMADYVKIDDQRIGGGKDTLVLNASGKINNVGIQFSEDDEVQYELFKTGKNHLSLNKVNEATQVSEAIFVVGDDKVMRFSELPSVLNDPTDDDELVNFGFLKNYVANHGLTPGSNFSPGGEITAVDKLTVIGTNASVVELEGVNKQWYGGTFQNKTWGIGKLNLLQNDILIENKTGSTPSSITLREDGDIQTNHNLTVGNEKGVSIITMLANNRFSDCKVEFKSVGSVKGYVGLDEDDLEMNALKGNIVFRTTPGKSLLIENGHATEKIMITESGQITNRPTTNLVVGQQFLDLTLKKPIWLYSKNPSVWIDAFGTTV